MREAIVQPSRTLLILMIFAAVPLRSYAKNSGCSTPAPTGVQFHANSATPDINGSAGQNGVMKGVNFKAGTRLKAPAASNVYVYSHCIGGPTAEGDSQWTDEWDPTEKLEVQAMAAGCQMTHVFGADKKRWLGPEGIQCAAGNFISYARLNPEIRIHVECDNMTYLEKSFPGGELDAYKLLVAEIKKSGVCNLLIVPKNLSDDQFKAVRALDPSVISNVGARETTEKNPSRCARVGDMIIAQNADAETADYRLNANPQNCGK